MPPDSPRIADLKRRVEADPASIAFAQLAEEYRRAGNYEAAEQCCRTGLSRHPGYLSARVTLGRSLVELGNLEDAATELQFVLKTAPDNLAAIRGMAEIRQRQGDLEGALEFFNRALPLARHDRELEETIDRITRELATGAGLPAMEPPPIPAAAPPIPVGPPPIPSAEPALAEVPAPAAPVEEPVTPAEPAAHWSDGIAALGPAFAGDDLDAVAEVEEPAPEILPAVHDEHDEPVAPVEPAGIEDRTAAFADIEAVAADYRGEPAAFEMASTPEAVAPAAEAQAPADEPVASAVTEPPVSDTLEDESLNLDATAFDFDALVHRLGAQRTAPPMVEAILADSVPAAGADPLLPELPAETTANDPFATLEQGLRAYDTPAYEMVEAKTDAEASFTSTPHAAPSPETAVAAAPEPEPSLDQASVEPEIPQPWIEQPQIEPVRIDEPQAEESHIDASRIEEPPVEEDAAQRVPTAPAPSSSAPEVSPEFSAAEQSVLDELEVWLAALKR